jgi:hypothetical protein
MKLFEVAQLEELVVLIGISPSLKPVFKAPADGLAEGGKNIVPRTEIGLNVSHWRCREVSADRRATGECQAQDAQQLSHDIKSRAVLQALCRA